MRKLAWSALVALAMVGMVVAGHADEKTAPEKEKKVPTLKDLAWMTGTWVEAQKDSVLTESWGAPQGDAMVGHDHWTVGGKTRMYELVAIERTDAGLVLRIRHFGKGLGVPSSEKDGPISFPLESLEGQRVVFEHPTRAWPRRMEYERKGDVMTGRLSGVENGKPSAIPFRFELRGAS